MIANEQVGTPVDGWDALPTEMLLRRLKGLRPGQPSGQPVSVKLLCELVRMTWMHIRQRTAYERGVVAEVVPNGKALSRARELAEVYLKAPEVTRRNTRVHFMQPLKERIVREVGLSLEASAADLVKSMQAKSEPVAQKGKVA
jgi:hypothetical protein